MHGSAQEREQFSLIQCSTRKNSLGQHEQPVSQRSECIEYVEFHQESIGPRCRNQYGENTAAILAGQEDVSSFVSRASSAVRVAVIRH